MHFLSGIARTLGGSRTRAIDSDIISARSGIGVKLVRDKYVEVGSEREWLYRREGSLKGHVHLALLFPGLSISAFPWVPHFRHTKRGLKNAKTVIADI